ncbi:oligosaccharide flippase family protein [Geobacter argillaceus]|uniref:O-antigen/teichoic acid export membrane protein n=1 Tax=Geobacter argillaceus TaxID=345631 RepID=A0A562WT34_9BACT|nr:oligosaccharide flippase family protein [Geobacter argillaceus]TWJ32604.1 O-antigen/teichoic acid export membrane protein [Geobacter argillaceus]
MLISKRLTFRAVAEMAGLVIGALSVIYISRVVGPEYLGFSATTSAALLLVSRLADGGLTSLASQRLARDDEKLDALLAVTILPKIAASAILIMATLLVTYLLPLDPRLKYFIAVSVFLVFFEACTPAWVFVAMGRINAASAIRIGQSFLYAASLLIFIHKPEDWRYLPFLTLFNSFINLAMATAFLWHFKLYSFDRALFKHQYVRKVKAFYREAGHFLKAELSVYVYTTSDRLILYYFTNAHTVGIYEAAYKVINPFYSINSVITPTMFRELAQSFKQGKLYPVMAKYVFTMSIFTIPLGFFLLFFSRDVVSLLYGTKFLGSVDPLRILGFVITFGFTSGIIVQPFAVWNMSREYGTSIFWGNVLNTILNFSLIPFFGAVGAALATLAAKVIVTVVGYNYFKKAVDYPIVKDFYYFFSASIIPTVIVATLASFALNRYVLMITYGIIYSIIVAFAYYKYFRFNQRPTAG